MEVYKGYVYIENGIIDIITLHKKTAVHFFAPQFFIVYSNCYCLFGTSRLR